MAVRERMELKVAEVGEREVMVTRPWEWVAETEWRQRS